MEPYEEPRTLVYVHNPVLRRMLRSVRTTTGTLVAGPETMLLGMRFDTIIILDQPPMPYHQEIIDTTVRCRLEPNGRWVEVL